MNVDFCHITTALSICCGMVVYVSWMVLNVLLRGCLLAHVQKAYI